MKPTDENGQQQVCLLVRAMYGLKQAPRYWNKTITAWLVEYGFLVQGRPPASSSMATARVSTFCALTTASWPVLENLHRQL
jgi:hypothetical protein